VQEFKNIFGGPDNEIKWQQAIEYTQRLDLIRNHTIVDYLPEFKGIYNV